MTGLGRIPAGESSTMRTPSAPPRPTPSLRRGTAALAALCLAATFLAGCPHASGQPTTPPPVQPLPTTEDPIADADFRAAREAEDRGELEDARQGYQRFLVTHPSDPLAPVADLRLGRMELAEGKLEEAVARFERVAAAEDLGVAERGKLYLAVALHHQGEHARARELLEPLMGRFVESDEATLQLRTSAAVCLALVDEPCAVRSFDALLSGPAASEERDAVAAELERLVEHELTAEELSTLYGDLPRSGPGFALVAKRSLRLAFAAGDMPRASRIASDLRASGVPLEGELLAIVERAERMGRADPKVIGAILPLSGRGREVGQHALRALTLAAGAADGGASAGAFQVVARDGAGDPERAARAVDELVTLHRAVAIIGPLDVASAERAARRAQELGVPLIALSPLASVVEAGPMAFQLFTSPTVEVEELARAAYARGARRFAALFPSNGYGRAMRAALAAELQRLGARLVAEVPYAPAATSFAREARTLANARPDAVLVPDRASKVVLIAPSLAAAGLRSVRGVSQAGPAAQGALLLVPSVGADQALLAPSARYLEGAIFSVPFDPGAAMGPEAAFRNAYETRYGLPPNAFAAFAYDAFQLVRAAVARGARSRAEVAAALPRTRGLATAGPSDGFSPSRTPARATRLMTWRGAGMVPVL